MVLLLLFDVTFYSATNTVVGLVTSLAEIFVKRETRTGERKNREHE